MHDFTIQLQAKHRIDEINRASARRHWLRDLLDSQKAERAARKSQPVRTNAERSQYE